MIVRFVSLVFAVSLWFTPLVHVRAQQTERAQQSSQTARELLRLLPPSDLIVYVDTERMMNEALPGLFGRSPQALAGIGRLVAGVENETGIVLSQTEMIVVGVPSDEKSGGAAVNIARTRGDADAAIKQFAEGKRLERELAFYKRDTQERISRLIEKAVLNKFISDAGAEDNRSRQLKLSEEVPAVIETLREIKFTATRRKTLLADSIRQLEELQREAANLTRFAEENFPNSEKTFKTEDARLQTELRQILPNDPRRLEKLQSVNQKIADLDARMSREAAVYAALSEPNEEFDNAVARFDALSRLKFEMPAGEAEREAALQTAPADAQSLTQAVRQIAARFEAERRKPPTVKTGAALPKLPDNLLVRTEEMRGGKRIVLLAAHDITPPLVGSPTEDGRETAAPPPPALPIVTALLALDARTFAAGDPTSVRTIADRAAAKPAPDPATGEQIETALKNPRAFIGFSARFKIAVPKNQIDLMGNLERANSPAPGALWQLYGSLVMVADEIEAGFNLQQKQPAPPAEMAQIPLDAATLSAPDQVFNNLFGMFFRSFAGLEGEFKLKITRQKAEQILRSAEKQ